MNYIVHKAVEFSALNKKEQATDPVGTWIISPKYDGCHAVFCFDQGKHVATYSRSGEVVKSMDHIATSLLDLYGHDFGNERAFVSGEAWALGKEFNEISGMFRRQSAQPDLWFVPFDYGPFDYNDQGFDKAPVLLGQRDSKPFGMPYWARIRNLKNQQSFLPSKVLRPRYETYGGSRSEALLLAKSYAQEHKARTDSFFDGAVLADGAGTYKVGSGKGGEFIKVKPLLSYSVIVHGYEADKGEKTGKNTVALLFNLDGREQKVATGLIQAQVDDIVNNFKDNWKDVTIEVEAMGITVNGFLREPRFKGIRTDA